MLLKELLNKKSNYQVTVERRDQFVTIATIGERDIRFDAGTDDGENWEVAFEELKSEKGRPLPGTYQKTGSGKELEVFAMIKDSLLEFIQRYHPAAITFTADKDDDKDTRADVYEKLLRKFKVKGYKVDRTKHENYSWFTITREIE